jgi:hypothetical protein
LALEAGGVDGGDAAAICGAADDKSVEPAAAVELLGIVGASNVANATKEFESAQSF